VEPPAPERLIKSGLPTEAMVASVLVAKYGWNLPLYRQAKMLAAQGLDLDRSTLAFWVGYAAAELTPLYERLKANLLTSAKLAVDETWVPVLDPGRGKTKTGYFWTMARDNRPWAGADPPAVTYTYAPGRGGEHLEALLATYRGVVQCDGYAPYKNLPADRITIAFLLEPLEARVLQGRRAKRCANRHRSRGADRPDLCCRKGGSRRQR
jgi:transposase